MNDTIYAVATGAGRAAVSIVRVSGPAAHAAIGQMAGSLPRPRRASLRHLVDQRGALLDQALVLWFPAPASATGEDVAEFHLHGGHAVISAVLAELGKRPHFRLAEPGEFTRRAFLNGKLDLSEVEGLADLIEAETESQRRQAMRQRGGALGEWVNAQRQVLLEALAATESAIDFSDEGDIGGNLADEVLAGVERLRGAIQVQLAQAINAARLRDGLVVALAGPPNVGKSTLLNVLAKREVAIVSPLPGTTRDPIEVRLDLDGLLVNVVDTAGMRQTDEIIEREGVKRAVARARDADLVLWLTDLREPCPPDATLSSSAIWRVATKADLAPTDRREDFDHVIAAPTGAGMPALIAGLGAFVDQAAADSAIVVRERHRIALVEAERVLSAIAAEGADLGLELVADQLRSVASLLESLVGQMGTEDVLGSIFARFCIGK